MRVFACLLQRQRGGILLESLIAVGLLGTVTSMTVQGLATGSRAVGVVSNLTTAQNLVRSQVEYTMGAPYCALPCASGYTAVAAPIPYTVTAEAEDYPG